MIEKITLQNFMSHSCTELELATGLTVLTGPNNCGKSAVVEAIRTICENSGKDFMVRHGEKLCRVVIETDDGHTIEWKREKAVVSYTIDGRDVHRLGGSVPDDLHELLRLPHVVSPDGKDEFDIHIALQKEPLFLLERSGREAAMFFASSSDAALVMDMQRRHKARVTDRKRDELQLTRQQQQLKDRLECLDPVQQVDEKLLAAETLHEQIQEGIATAKLLDLQLVELQQQMDRIDQTGDRFLVLQALPAPPELDDTVPLEKLLRDIQLSEQAGTHNQNKCEQLEKLSAPPMLVEIANLSSLCELMDRQMQECSRIEARLEITEAIPDEPELAVLSELSAAIAAISTATEQVRERTAEVEVRTVAVVACLSAIRDWATANPSCPVCGGIVDADDLILSQGHSHA